MTLDIVQVVDGLLGYRREAAALKIQAAKKDEKYRDVVARVEELERAVTAHFRVTRYQMWAGPQSIRKALKALREAMAKVEE